MQRKKKLLVWTTLVTLAFVAMAAIYTPTARAWYVYGAYRSPYGSYAQDIGSAPIQGEDRYYSSFYGDCYGACGPSCSYVCSWGGACEVHDYYTRKHGMFSWQALVTFPPALIQWGACQTYRAIDWVWQTVKSIFTGVVKSISKFISGIFN